MWRFYHSAVDSLTRKHTESEMIVSLVKTNVSTRDSTFISSLSNCGLLMCAAHVEFILITQLWKIILLSLSRISVTESVSLHIGNLSSVSLRDVIRNGKTAKYSTHELFGWEDRGHGAFKSDSFSTTFRMKPVPSYTRNRFDQLALWYTMMNTFKGPSYDRVVICDNFVFPKTDYFPILMDFAGARSDKNWRTFNNSTIKTSAALFPSRPFIVINCNIIKIYVWVVICS